MSFSLANYCNTLQQHSQLLVDDWNVLPESTRNFLQQLGLPTIHPFCIDTYIPPEEITEEGPLRTIIHENIWDTIITLFWMKIPPLWAFFELWIRLFASIIAPCSILYILKQDHNQSILMNSCHNNKKGTSENKGCCSVINLIAVASSAIVMTDSMYVLEYGVFYGMFLMGLSLLLTTRRTRIRRQQQYKYTPFLAIMIFAITLLLTWDTQETTVHFGTPTDVNIHIQPGLYYNNKNDLIRTAVQKFWPTNKYSYNNPTPWMVTGDARTGLPFFFNRVSKVKWHRVFLPIKDEDEDVVLALDMAFPKYGYDPTKPIYMILHGANGGSEEDYCRDLAIRRTSEGSTVIVMVSRGLMDLPLQGYKVYRGDRASDAHATATALRQAMEPDQILAGVGYSMGAIVLNNYVTKYGKDCALSVAFSISGSLECHAEMNFKRPKRVWEPMVADYMRDRHMSKWGERTLQRLSKTELKGLLRTINVVDVDQYVVVLQNRPRYRDLTDFYTQMSALGDIPMNDLRSHTDNITEVIERNRHSAIANVSIPLCILHAFDDPIATWRNIAENDGLMHPTNLVRTGTGNVVVLLTEKGGHVGWPISWFPFQHNWEYMNEAAASFVESIQKAKDYIQDQEIVDKDFSNSSMYCPVYTEPSHSFLN